MTQQQRMREHRQRMRESRRQFQERLRRELDDAIHNMAEERVAWFVEQFRARGHDWEADKLLEIREQGQAKLRATAVIGNGDT